MFFEDDRNKNLRSLIIKQHISGLMTDEERAAFWGLPAGCRMRDNSKIIMPQKLKCGDYVHIGEGALLDASGGLEIGSHTSIGPYCLIFTHTSFLTNLTMSNQVGGSGLIERGSVEIGEGTLVGGHTVVLHGKKIGSKSIILPLSLITRDIPDNCIAGGNPVRIIQTIDQSYVEKQLERINSINKSR